MARALGRRNRPLSAPLRLVGQRQPFKVGALVVHFRRLGQVVDGPFSPLLLQRRDAQQSIGLRQIDLTDFVYQFHRDYSS